MAQKRRFALMFASVPILAIALAACGSDDSSDSSTTTAATTTAESASTVSAQSIGGTDVLVDADGNALYTNDQDSVDDIKCTKECAGIWVPLAADSGSQPSSDDSSVADKLGTVDRPDGTTQVTLDEEPLYTFTEDTPGQVTGDGFTDSFGGVTFAWTVAAPSGESSEAAPPATTDDSDSGAGGYGY